MADLKILIADDEPTILEIMAKKVAQSGFEVITAVDGEDAWEKIVSLNPDVILLDITMPRLDGWGVVRRLRSQPPSKKWQPIIIVSALSEMSHIQKGFDLEADHYLTKPCRMDDIIRGIKSMANLIPMRRVSSTD